MCGKVGIKKKIKDTLSLLRLYKKYHCVVIPNIKPYLGMITKVKDFITWGEIDKETLKLLLEKRGRLPNKQQLTENYVKEKLNFTLSQFAENIFNFKNNLKDLPGLRLFFKLSPPRGGFERKGTKHPYSMGGALGYRKEKINDLIKKMI
jgi:large subunit ribosomal protein L30